MRHRRTIGNPTRTEKYYSIIREEGERMIIQPPLREDGFHMLVNEKSSIAYSTGDKRDLIADMQDLVDNRGWEWESRGRKRRNVQKVSIKTARNEYEEPLEPDEEDVIISYTDEIFSGSEYIGKASDWEIQVKLIQEWMKGEGFYPNVWQLSDHGNYHLIRDFPHPESRGGRYKRNPSRTTEKSLREWVQHLADSGVNITIEWAYGQPRCYSKEGRGLKELSPRLPTGQMAIWLDGFTKGLNVAE